MTLTAREISQEPGPTPETITMTVAELEQLVTAMVLRCFDKLGLTVNPDLVSEVLAHQGIAITHQAGEPQPVLPVPPDPADPSLVVVYCLRPIYEQGMDFARGASFPTTPERAAKLADLGLVTLDQSQVPPPPPAAGPKASALSMQGAPGGLIRSGR